MAENLFFIFFAVLASVSLISFNRRMSDGLTKALFITFSIPLVLFSIFRPIGLMRDDGFYQNIIKEIPFYEFPERLLNLRDPLWYGLVYILTGISENVEILLYLSGFVLILKLIILYIVAGSNRLLVFFLYACAYWQLHDLTQLRLSISALMFMGFLFFSKINLAIISRLSIISSMFFHAQAMVNIIFLIKFKLFERRILLYILPFFLLLIGANFMIDINQLAGLAGIFLNDRESLSGLAHTLNAYQIMTHQGLYDNNYRLPLILLASSFAYLIVLYSIDGVKYKQFHVKSATLSITLAIVLSWVFASMSDIQVRFYEYYFLGGLFLVSETKSRLALLAVYVLAILYFFKFNILWNIWDVTVLNSILK